MLTRSLITAAFGLVLTGCAGSGAIDYKKPGPTKVYAFQGKPSEQPPEARLPSQKEYESDLCTPAEDPNTDAVIEGVLVAIAKGIVSIGFDSLEKSLEKELETYTATYNAAAQTNLLSSGDIQALKCFRIVRFAKEKPKAGESRLPVAEIIAQVGIVDAVDGKVRETVANPAAFKIRPLRVALCKSAAESANKTYGLSANVKVTSFWSDDGIGYSSAMEKPHSFLPKAKLDLKKSAGRCSEAESWEVKSFADKDFPWDKLSPLPLPVTEGAGIALFEFSVAEAGDQPAALKAAKKLFGASKDGLSELVKNAVAAAIEGDEEDGNDEEADDDAEGDAAS